MAYAVKTYGKLSALPPGGVTAKGWIRDQLLRSKAGMGGHLDELEPNMIANPYVNCKTDEEWGAQIKAGWGAEISGNYWYGLIELAWALDDAELKAKAEKWVNAVLANQRPDGYLGTYTEKDNLFDDYNAWGTNCGMRALLAYYEATGREDVLEAVHRCMLWFCDNWTGDRKTRYGGSAIIDSMGMCYAHTGDRRLLDFVNDYVEFMNRKDLYKYSFNAMMENDLVYNSGHAAGYGMIVKLPVIAYMAGGNESYLKAGINAVRKAIGKVVLPNGGISSNTEYICPVWSGTEVEYCAFAFFNNSLIWLAQATGDPRYADWIERIVFNGAQGARRKDEKAIAYFSSPNQIFATEHSTHSHGIGQAYAPCHPVSCCPVTSVWVVPDYVRGMGMTDREGNPYVCAYGPAVIRFGNLTLDEETRYPFRDAVRFTVSAGRPEKTAIHFRVPSWCGNAEFSVNGAKAAGDPQPGTYFAIEREWRDGDRIDVRFPMEVRVSRIDDSDAYSHYPLSVERGPLVYALPIPEIWTAIKGHPRTPLPEGWSWYDVTPVIPVDPTGDVYEQMGLRKYNIGWNVAIDEKLDPSDVGVIEIEGGFVWESPPVKLRLPGYKALYSYAPYIAKTFEPYQGPIDVQAELELELVPYGCTNLRISHFPRAKL